MAEIIIDYATAIKEIQTYEKLVAELTKKEGDLKKQLQAGNITRKEYTKSMADGNAEMKRYRESIKVLTAEMAKNLKQQQQLKSNVEGLTAVLKELNNQYDSLNEADKKALAGEVLLSNINKTEEALKSAENAFVSFTTLVGDYQQSISGLVTELEELTTLLVNIGSKGDQHSETLQKMAEKAEELKEAITGVKEEIDEFSSDFSTLDVLKETISFLTKSYGLFKDTTSLLGIEHEELDRVIKGTISTLSALKTVIELKNALDKQSIIIKTAENVKAWAAVMAVNAETAAKTKSGIASKLAAAAQWLFNVAVSANPIGLFIALLVGAVAAVYGLIKAFDFFNSSSKKNREALRLQGEQLEQNIKADERHLEVLKAKGKSEQEILNKSIDLYGEHVKQAEQYAEKLKKEYGKDSDEYKEALERKEELNDKYDKSLDKGYDTLLKLQAQANDSAMRDSMSETEYVTQQANKAFEEQMETLGKLKDAGKITADEYDELAESIEGVRKKSVQAAEDKEKKQKEDEAKAENDKRLKAIQAAKAAEEKLIRESKEREAKLIREGEELILSLILDSAEKQRMVLTNSYEKKRAELVRQLEEEGNLTEIAREELNKKLQLMDYQHQEELKRLSDEEIKSQIKKEEERLNHKLKMVEKGSREEYILCMELMKKQEEAELAAFGDHEEEKEKIRQKYELLQSGITDESRLEALRASMDAELQMVEENEQRKLEIQAEYRQQEAEYKEEFNEKIKEKLQEDFEERMETLAEQSLLELQNDMQRLKDRLDSLHQLEGESEEEFKARQLEAENEYLTAKELLGAKEMQIEQLKTDLMQEMNDQVINMIEKLGEQNKAFAIASKMIALGEIAVQTGVAIAKGVAQAQSVPFPANIAAVITTIATVMGNISTAVQSVKSAKFAQGGLVTGPGSETSDSIPARLSNGESVLTARATQMFAPVLSAFNTMGGGVPINTASSSNTVLGEEMLARAVAKGVTAMPAPVVAVQEINAVNRSVSVIQDLGAISL